MSADPIVLTVDHERAQRQGTLRALPMVEILKVHSRYVGRTVRLGVGFVPEGSSARQTAGGPNVPGPWAYTYPHAAVIDNYGGTGVESRRRIAEGTEYEVEIGQTVLIDGLEFTLEDNRRYSYPDLVHYPYEKSKVPSSGPGWTTL